MISANDYKEYEYANPRPWDTENPDGMAKGQFADYHFTGGFGLGDRCENYHVPALGLKPFGCEAGDCVAYAAETGGFRNPVLTVRYRSATPGDAAFTLNGKKSFFRTVRNLHLPLLIWMPAIRSRWAALAPPA